MSGDSLRPAFARFYSRSRQLDESLEVIRGRSFLSAGVPDLFPGLVGFPLVAVIEELDAPKVLFMPRRILRRQRLTFLGDMAEAVPRRVT